MFLAQHIDSIIQIILGISFTWLGFRPGGRFPARTQRIIRICGPALIGLGALLMFRPHAGASWQRRHTADNVASVEFPGAATAQETNDTYGTLTVKRTSLSYSAPGKDLSLFLSSSALTEDALALSEEQRLDGSLAMLSGQGSQVLKRETLAGSPSIHRVTLRSEGGKTTTRIALAYVGTGVYRVVASWADGSEDPALTDRFIGSFRIGAAPAQ